ncbi:MAG: hypothetical protein WBQ23_02500 [Bacteroidota bacterium]
MQYKYFSPVSSDASRTLALPLLAVLAMLLSTSACTDSSTEPALSDEERIQETTLRFMTELNWESRLQFATYASIAITPFDNSDEQLTALSPSVFHQLQNIDHPLRPFSECTIGIGGVSHPDFTSGGICIWVGTITYTGSGSAVVYAGYFVGSLGAAGYLVRVERTETTWQIVGFHMVFVS